MAESLRKGDRVRCTIGEGGEVIGLSGQSATILIDGGNGVMCAPLELLVRVDGDGDTEQPASREAPA